MLAPAQPADLSHFCVNGMTIALNVFTGTYSCTGSSTIGHVIETVKASDGCAARGLQHACTPAATAPVIPQVAPTPVPAAPSEPAKTP